MQENLPEQGLRLCAVHIYLTAALAAEGHLTLSVAVPTCTSAMDDP